MRHSGPELPPDLAALVTAWPTLPEPSRFGPGAVLGEEALGHPPAGGEARRLGRTPGGLVDAGLTPADDLLDVAV